MYASNARQYHSKMKLPSVNQLVRSKKHNTIWRVIGKKKVRIKPPEDLKALESQLTSAVYLYYLRIKGGKPGFNRNRKKFKDEFMIDRHRAMAAALEAAVSESKPNIDWIVQKYEEIEALKRPYKAWIEVLADHYMDLLLAVGENFESLVRGHTASAPTTC